MKKPLDIKSFTEYAFLSSLKASPDKKRCVFNLHRADLAENGYKHWLWLYEPELGAPRQLSFEGGESQPFWLNDSTVVFARAEKDQDLAPGQVITHYHYMDLDSGESGPFMDIPAAVSYIAPLENGKFAVLARSYLPDRLSPSYTAQPHETWSGADPDYIVGDELPFRQDGLGLTNGMRMRCFLFDRAAGRLSPVSKDSRFIESINVQGNKIIFSARDFQKNSAYSFYGDVEVYDDDSGKLDILMDDNSFRVYAVGFVGGVPCFAGTRGLEHGFQNQNSSFFRIEPGREPVCFCHNDRSCSNTVVNDVRYGPSTGYICTDQGFYYLSTEGGSAVIKLAGTDGVIRLVSDREGTADDFALMEGGLLYVGMHDNSLQELYFLRDGRSRRVSSFNSAISEGYSLSAPLPLSFESAGLELAGYVIPPVGFEPGGSYPAILYIHGGHKCAFGPVFYHEMQVWANRGFFVLFCNPRGSDGRDDEFADVIGHYGFWEEEDLLAFKDACLSRYPQIDPARLGVGGGSYGGYLTNWLIGRTHCFKCAVSQRGIASWSGMFFTSDTNYLFPCWSVEPNDVWMDPERYWLHSPLKYAGDCDTPTLFIHSDQDYRCPVSEGLSMFCALQYRGIESRICIFKGESHGLSRTGRPKNRVKRLEEITAWFEKYLRS